MRAGFYVGDLKLQEGAVPGPTVSQSADGPQTLKEVPLVKAKVVSPRKGATPSRSPSSRYWHLLLCPHRGLLCLTCVNMPRRRKGKARARKKHNQTRADSKSHKRVQEAAAVGDESPSCSSVLDGDPQRPSATETSSTYQGSWRPSSTTITSSGALDTRSDKGDKSQDKEHSWSSEVPSPETSCSDLLTTKLDLLEQFLLCKYEMQEPILKEDMLKIVGEINPDQFADLIKTASDHIEAVFAVDLKEVDSSNHAYDLVSKLNLPNNGRVYAGNGLPKTGLLMSILGVIFMKGNSATEEDIWKFLNIMEVYAGREHRIYGEPWKLINTDLVQLQYLEYRQVPDSDPARYEFLWGPRARAETSKMQVLQFLAKGGDTGPSAFSPWYEEALRDEERTRATESVRAATGATARHDITALAALTPSDV
ncbi:melanoma-associated antigen B5-like [Rhinolophus ferrumequinum]|uniref:melanoma-associated antigen B5-like n=1 Tax=Rhinolophus ferrumequinum TaxID=59479 RepID=UPI00140F7BBA|nr:melanoma-associated antigen B5-like [Rhinolophus ferrumequinum]